jgi:hypothetical protein
MSLDIYEKIPEADTSEFTSAKKVRFDTPIRIDDEPVEKAFVAAGTGLGAGTAIFREKEHAEELGTRMLAEGMNEFQAKTELIRKSDSHSLKVYKD